MRRLFYALLIALLAAVALFDLYTRTPDTFVIAPFEIAPNASHLVVYFHGSDGGDEPLIAAMETRTRDLLGPAAQVINYRWSAGSDNRMRANSNALKFGETLGEQLAQQPQLKHLHLIIHSAGAFIPDALCERYRAQASTPAHIEVTYIDPFGIRGLLDWRFGARNHGRCADFASTLLNTDDGAPSTNYALASAYNIDVTDHPDRAAFTRDYHYWPLQYFLDELDERALTPAARNHANYPRGTVVSWQQVP